MTPAETSERILVQPAQVLARHRHAAGVGPLQAGHDHEQRGLAGAGGSHQTDGLAAGYIEVDFLENMNAGGALPEREIDAGKRDRRPRLGVFGHVAFPFCASLIWGPPAPGPASCRAHGRVLGRALGAGPSLRARCCPDRQAGRPAADASRKTGQDRGAGGFADRRLRRGVPTMPFPPSLPPRSKPRASRRAWSMPAFPAIPPAAGSTGSTGRCRTAPTR